MALEKIVNSILKEKMHIRHCFYPSIFRLGTSGCMLERYIIRERKKLKPISAFKINKCSIKLLYTVLILGEKNEEVYFLFIARTLKPSFTPCH